MACGGAVLRTPRHPWRSRALSVRLADPTHTAPTVNGLHVDLAPPEAQSGDDQRGSETDATTP